MIFFLSSNKSTSFIKERVQEQQKGLKAIDLKEKQKEKKGHTNEEQTKNTKKVGTVHQPLNPKCIQKGILKCQMQ